MFGSSNARTIQTALVAKDRATPKLDDVEDAGDRASESLDRTEQRLGSMTQALAATGAATTALGGGIAMLVSRFGKLDQEFRTIETTSGATSEQMEQIRDAARDVSTELPVALAESTAAAKQLSFAGLSASETMAALSETSQLAVAGQMQTSQAAQTVARSLNAFELDAEQATAVVSSLGQTFASSATDIRSLTQGLNEVQATANAAGLSVAETTAALGQLSSAGLAGSKSGTSLNAVLSRLTGNSSETQKALEELGLATSDFTNEEGELQSMSAIMSTLSSEMENASQAEQIRLAQQIAGREGARALLPLMNQTDELSQKINDNLRAEIQGAVGDLSEMDSSEIEATSEALGMEVSGQTSTVELINNLQELDEQGESTEQITSRLQVGLGLTSDSARLLAEDITETNQSADQLAENIGGVVTAEQLAEDQTKTLSGQIQQLRSDFQVLGEQMYQGTKPAVTELVSAFRAISTPIAQNESAARALGGGLIVLTGAAGLATAALGAHVVQLKLATLAHKASASSTLAGSAALKAHAVSSAAASKATWLLTASTTQLRRATMMKTASLWLSAKAQYASATAALADASAKGLMTTATLAAAGAMGTLWTALGPIGLIVLALTAGIVGLAGVMKTDLLGAGEEAGAVLGWFGDKAGVAWAATKQLLGILWELGRIGATLGGMALLAPFAAVLKLPDLIRDVGPEAKAAAMRLPSQIVAGLAQMGPRKYAIPILGPMLLARDMITDPNRWITAGQQIPLMLAEGIAQMAGVPVEEVTGMVGEAREYLPFSPAKKGPLQDIDKTGPALVSTIADGVESEQGQLTSTLGAMFEATPLGMAVGAASDAVGGGGQSQSSGPKYEVTVTNNIRLEGGAEGSTEESLERAAETGTSTALEDFFNSLSRET